MGDRIEQGTESAQVAEPAFGMPVGPWFRWFAWHPTKTTDRGWRWLRPVWRRRYQAKPYLDGPTMWWFNAAVADPRAKRPMECDGCLCPTEHDGDYGSAGHVGPCPPHTCGLSKPPAPRPDPLRDHRQAWADYIERWDGSVGPEPPTVERIIAALRLPSPPFGMAASENPYSPGEPT